MKKERFVFMPNNMVIIADISWWYNNAIEIETWIKINFGSSRRKGVVLIFEIYGEVILFKLRWG